VPDSAVETTQFLVRKVRELRRSAIARFFQPPIAPAITIYLVAQTMKEPPCQDAYHCHQSYQQQKFK